MNCNFDILNSLIAEGEYVCPFCDKQLKDYISVEKDELCCSAKELLVKDGIIVCTHCGQVCGENFANEWVGFYENLYKFKRKSVYQRKYHIKNVLDDICFKHRIQISYNDIAKINMMVKKIEGVLLTDKRRRSIKFSFIFHKLFKIIQSPCYNK